MQVSVIDAQGQLTDLVARAEAGDDVVLTRDGRAAVRLVPVVPTAEMVRRRAMLEAIVRKARLQPDKGPSAARSQDFLYNEDGLPG